MLGIQYVNDGERNSIVKKHEGFISVYSEENKGTSFKIYFPASELSQEHESEIATSDIPLGRGELILLVDDEALIREVTKEALESAGYRVNTAADGAEAVALYAEKKSEVDLVITDGRMPIMDGSTTIKVLQKMNPGIRVIVTSGLSSIGTEIMQSNGNVLAYLQKPFSANTLLETVANVLHQEA